MKFHTLGKCLKRPEILEIKNFRTKLLLVLVEFSINVLPHASIYFLNPCCDGRSLKRNILFQDKTKGMIHAKWLYQIETCLIEVREWEISLW